MPYDIVREGKIYFDVTCMVIVSSSAVLLTYIVVFPLSNCLPLILAQVF